MLMHTHAHTYIYLYIYLLIYVLGVGSTTTASGRLDIMTASQTSAAGTAVSGDMFLGTGTARGDTGGILLQTGDSVAGRAGAIVLAVGSTETGEKDHQLMCLYIHKYT